MRTILMLTCIALSVTACSRFGRNTTLYDGQFYNTRSRTAGEDKHDFTVTVRPVSKGLNGARQAGLHEAVKYCIRLYGTSDIAWTVGPDTTDESLSVSDDTLTFAGRCVE